MARRRSTRTASSSVPVVPVVPVSCKGCGISDPQKVHKRLEYVEVKTTREYDVPYTTSWQYYCDTCWKDGSPAYDASKAVEKFMEEWSSPEAIAGRKLNKKVKGLEDCSSYLKEQSASKARTASLPVDGDEKVATMLRSAGALLESDPDWDRSVCVRYDSLTEFLAVLDTPCAYTKQAWNLKYNNDFEANDIRREQLRNAPHWRLGKSWEGSLEDMTLDQLKDFWFGGWHEGLEKMREAMGRIEVPETEDVRRRAVWAETGCELSLDRIYSGQYETAWRSTHRRRVVAPTKVRIVVDIGSACGACNLLAHDAEIVQASTLFWRGAAATALCETLDAAGFQTEILIAFAGTDNAPTSDSKGQIARYDTALAATAVTVKGFTDPAELAVITSATAAASVFRRAFLMWLLTVSKHQVGQSFHDLRRVELEPLIRERLNLDEPEIATVYVPDWCLSPGLANLWASATHKGIESANDPHFEAFDFTEEMA